MSSSNNFAATTFALDFLVPATSFRIWAMASLRSLQATARGALPFTSSVLNKRSLASHLAGSSPPRGCPISFGGIPTPK